MTGSHWQPAGIMMRSLVNVAVLELAKVLVPAILIATFVPACNGYLMSSVHDFWVRDYGTGSPGSTVVLRLPTVETSLRGYWRGIDGVFVASIAPDRELRLPIVRWRDYRWGERIPIRRRSGTGHALVVVVGEIELPTDLTPGTTLEGRVTGRYSIPVRAAPSFRNRLVPIDERSTVSVIEPRLENFVAVNFYRWSILGVPELTLLAFLGVYATVWWAAWQCLVLLHRWGTQADRGA
jgi:hypothetical protein